MTRDEKILRYKSQRARRKTVPHTLARQHTPTSHTQPHTNILNANNNKENNKKAEKKTKHRHVHEPPKDAPTQQQRKAAKGNDEKEIHPSLSSNRSAIFLLLFSSSSFPSDCNFAVTFVFFAIQTTTPLSSSFTEEEKKRHHLPSPTFQRLPLETSSSPS